MCWNRLADVPEEKRIYSPDRARVAAWGVAGHSEDRYDEVTRYEVVVFEADGRLAARIPLSHRVSSDGEERGAPLGGVRFGRDEGEVLLLFEDGRTAAVPLAPYAPDAILRVTEAGGAMPPAVQAFIEARRAQLTGGASAPRGGRPPKNRRRGRKG